VGLESSVRGDDERGAHASTLDWNSFGIRHLERLEAGETWNFQLWYRDGGGMSSFNLSDALNVVFCP